MMSEKKVDAKTEVLTLGYRAKREDEKTGPDDKVLIALDPDTQRDFERVIFTMIAEEESKLRGE